MLYRIAKAALNSWATELERYVRIKVLSLALEGIKGVRKVTQYYLYAFGFCIVLIASLFSFLVYSVDRYSITGSIPINAFTAVTALLVLTSSWSLLYMMREARWVDAFKVQEKLNVLVKPTASSPSDPLQVPSEAEMERLFDQWLERKLDERLAGLSSNIDQKIDSKFAQQDKSETYSAIREA